ncbi:MAG: sensor histidine kinase, partial [Flammeovirgaceae bacterium]
LTPTEQRLMTNLATSIEQLSQKIRRISSGHSAERVEEIGLEASLCEFLRKKDGVAGVSFHFEALGETRALPYARALAILRLVQEIAANSLKHAKCQNVWIRLFWEGGRIVLEAEDDGQTDGSKVASKSIRRRVDELNIKIINLDQFKGLHIQIIFDGW